MNECKDAQKCAQCGKDIPTHQVEADDGRIACKTAGAVLTDEDGAILGFSCSASCSNAWLATPLEELTGGDDGGELADDDEDAAEIKGYLVSLEDE